MTKKIALLPLMLLTTTLLVSGGCSGNGDNEVAGPTPGGDSDPSAMSTLRVFLTDKPAEEYLAVNVTVAGIRVHQSSSIGELEAGWVELPMAAAMPVDLLTLRNGVLLELGQTPLPAGHYQQIRLELEPNAGAEPPFNQSVVTADGVTHALEAPSGTIKIVHGFSTDPQQVTDLTLDFVASESIVARGNGTYALKPVIKASGSTAD